MACSAKSLKTYLSTQQWTKMKKSGKMILFLWLKKEKKLKKKTCYRIGWIWMNLVWAHDCCLYNLRRQRVSYIICTCWEYIIQEEIQNLWIINREPLALEPSLTPKSWLIHKAFCRFLHSLDNDGIKYNSRCSYIFGYRHLAFCLPPSHISEFPRGDF